MSILKRIITEDTLVPLSIVILLFTFVSWITTLYNETKANSVQIEEVKSDQRTQNEKLDQILEKLGRIEGKLGLHERYGR